MTVVKKILEILFSEGEERSVIYCNYLRRSRASVNELQFAKKVTFMQERKKIPFAILCGCRNLHTAFNHETQLLAAASSFYDYLARIEASFVQLLPQYMEGSITHDFKKDVMTDPFK